MDRVLDLLIIDDDPSQAALMKAVVRELGLPHHCHYAFNGSVALDFLRRIPPFERAPRPDLILLDLNMPGMNGREVLHIVKSDPALHSIPVIMLSSSHAIQEVAACYGEHANAYIQKPLDLEGNLSVVRHLDRFWSGLALLPDDELNR
jgi:CheY-like chemotaxis protein